MTSEKPQRIYRADYQEPDYWIDSVDLDFDLADEVTAVRAKLAVRRNPALRGDPPPLILVGEEMSLKGLWIDGEELAASRYRVAEFDLSMRSNAAGPQRYRPYRPRTHRVRSRAPPVLRSGPVPLCYHGRSQP